MLHCFFLFLSFFFFFCFLWLSNPTLAAFSPCGLHRCRPPYAWENTRKLSKKLKNKKGKGKRIEVEDHIHTESNFIFLKKKKKKLWGTSSSSFIFYRVWKLWCSFYSFCKGLSFFNICVRLFTQKIKNFTLNYKIY